MVYSHRWQKAKCQLVMSLNPLPHWIPARCIYPDRKLDIHPLWISPALCTPPLQKKDKNNDTKIFQWNDLPRTSSIKSTNQWLLSIFSAPFLTEKITKDLKKHHRRHKNKQIKGSRDYSHRKNKETKNGTDVLLKINYIYLKKKIECLGKKKS